jgi:hypothetical protein
MSRTRASAGHARTRAKPAADPGPPYEVLWHPAADAERAAIPDTAERILIQHAREKLEALGPQLGAPHTSAIKGEDGPGLRELRPRAGRSRWRPIYRRVQPRTFVILAIAPEAQIDKRGFDQKVTNARRRFEGFKPATPDHIGDNKLAIIPVRPKGKA